MTRRILIVAVLLVSLGVVTAPAQATVITASDFGDLALGGNVAGPLVRNIWTPDLSGQGGPASTVLGTLTSNVYQNGDVYTYAFVLTGSLVTEFNTGFNVLGFDSTLKAGFSFQDATDAGATGDLTKLFKITWNDIDKTIDWKAAKAQVAQGFWGDLDSITFFFQSIYGPENGNRYNVMTQLNVGSTSGYQPIAPVPEPGTLLLLGSGLVGAAGLRAFRRKR